MRYGQKSREREEGDGVRGVRAGEVWPSALALWRAEEEGNTNWTDETGSGMTWGCEG
jgi:hypothetical protein